MVSLKRVCGVTGAGTPKGKLPWGPLGPSVMLFVMPAPEDQGTPGSGQGLCLEDLSCFWDKVSRADRGLPLADPFYGEQDIRPWDTHVACPLSSCVFCYLIIIGLCYGFYLMVLTFIGAIIQCLLYIKHMDQNLIIS